MHAGKLTRTNCQPKWTRLQVLEVCQSGLMAHHWLHWVNPLSKRVCMEHAYGGCSMSNWLWLCLPAMFFNGHSWCVECRSTCHWVIARFWRCLHAHSLYAIGTIAFNLKFKTVLATNTRLCHSTKRTSNVKSKQSTELFQFVSSQIEIRDFAHFHLNLTVHCTLFCSLTNIVLQKCHWHIFNQGWQFVLR